MKFVATKNIISAAVEDYIRAIYVLQERGGSAVGTNALAARLGVTAASASAMVKKLSALGLAEHHLYRGVELTSAGVAIALEVIRHHRLLELFLVQELGFSWEEVDAEADVLEHVLSEEVEERIATRLGEPTHDPHGDPIPRADGTIVSQPTESLAAVAVGRRARIVRVSDSDPELLRYLAAQAIAVGDEVEVISQDPFDGPLAVRVGAATHALGSRIATAIRVEVIP